MFDLRGYELTVKPGLSVRALLLSVLAASSAAVSMHPAGKSVALAVVVVGVLAATTTAHMLGLGTCKKYDGMANFDPTKVSISAALEQMHGGSLHSEAFVLIFQDITNLC